MSLTSYALDWDDRREIWYLLDKLPKPERIAFLRWCCKQTCPDLQGQFGVQVTASSGETNECYFDLLHLEAVYQANLEQLVLELVRRVRRR